MAGQAKPGHPRTSGSLLTVPPAGIARGGWIGRTRAAHQPRPRRRVPAAPFRSGEAFLQQARPAFEAYGSGDHEEALAIFISAASGLDWATCRAVLEERLPGAVAQAIKDADTFFGIEPPRPHRVGVRSRGGGRY